jgi:DNA-binding MurR/RpiR family transcriptional regulator
MNDGNVMKRVREHYDDLGKSQQKVAEFFITSEEALYLSAARIAEILDVSHSTVVRTAQGIGFEGFPDLQAALQEQVFGRSTSAAAYELGKRKLNEMDEGGEQVADPAVLLRRLMLGDAHQIESVANEINAQDFALGRHYVRCDQTASSSNQELVTSLIKSSVWTSMTFFLPSALDAMPR